MALTIIINCLQKCFLKTNLTIVGKFKSYMFEAGFVHAKTRSFHVSANKLNKYYCSDIKIWSASEMNKYVYFVFNGKNYDKTINSALLATLAI